MKLAEFIEFMDYENLMRFACYSPEVAAKWRQTYPPYDFLHKCITGKKYRVLSAIPCKNWETIWKIALEIGDWEFFRYYLDKRTKSLILFAAEEKYPRELMRILIKYEYIYTYKFVLNIVLNSREFGDLVNCRAFVVYVIRNQREIAELIPYLQPGLQNRVLEFLRQLVV